MIAGEQPINSNFIEREAATQLTLSLEKGAECLFFEYATVLVMLYENTEQAYQYDSSKNLQLYTKGQVMGCRWSRLSESVTRRFTNHDSCICSSACSIVKMNAL